VTLVAKSVKDTLIQLSSDRAWRPVVLSKLLEVGFSPREAEHHTKQVMEYRAAGRECCIAAYLIGAGIQKGLTNESVDDLVCCSCPPTLPAASKAKS
jgi:hypothetical protein